MRLLTIALIEAVLGGVMHNASATDRPTITLEQLQTMFANIKSKTTWNLDGPLLWGYFFMDPDTKKLEAAGDELTRNGYHLVDIHRAKDRPTNVLHVERIEHHTPESLNQRNQELYALAERYQLGSYDGMDVGPPP